METKCLVKFVWIQAKKTFCRETEMIEKKSNSLGIILDFRKAPQAFNIYGTHSTRGDPHRTKVFPADSGDAPPAESVTHSGFHPSPPSGFCLGGETLETDSGRDPQSVFLGLKLWDLVSHSHSGGCWEI